jgi:hypothetical protein
MSVGTSGYILSHRAEGVIQKLPLAPQLTIRSYGFTSALEKAGMGTIHIGAPT